jgi:hypothetical protein
MCVPHHHGIMYQVAYEGNDLQMRRMIALKILLNKQLQTADKG